MAHRVRAAIIGSTVLAILASVSGCHTAGDPSPSPTVATTSVTPSPTPTPTPTYGPNQTAALATVTKYYDWINTYQKDPSFPNFGELNRLAKEEALSAGAASVNSLRFAGQRQVGDLVVVSLVPDNESSSAIGVSSCVDNSRASRIDSQGQPVARPAGIPARLAYSLKVRNDGGTWFVISDRGGTTSC